MNFNISNKVQSAFQQENNFNEVEYVSSSLSIPNADNVGLYIASRGTPPVWGIEGTTKVRLGKNAGLFDQSKDFPDPSTEYQAIAIGLDASGSKSSLQGNYSIALGSSAGYFEQGVNTIAIGFEAGKISQGGNDGLCVALGNRAGFENQGPNSIAVGPGAGSLNLGINSIAIGYNTSSENFDNTVVIGSNTMATKNNSVFIKSIYNYPSGLNAPTDGTPLFYSPSTGEIYTAF